MMDALHDFMLARPEEIGAMPDRVIVIASQGRFWEEVEAVPMTT
jgi:hypothetical protein